MALLKQELDAGYDGIAAVATQDFLDVWDTGTSKFNETAGQEWGFIKFANPGITELTVGSVTSATVDTYSRTNSNALFLNTEFLEYVVMAGSDLNLGPFVTPENQVAKTAILYNMANVVCSNRRKQGIHFKVPASITS